MKGGTPRSVMSESNKPSDPLRRRSPRLSSPPPPPLANLKTDNKMAAASFAVKRSITVRKIAPRKTTAPSEHNKENTPRPSGDNQQKVSTPGPAPDHGSSSSAKKKTKKAALPSPILPPSPPPSRPQESDPDAAVWSQKVRRSYSRLGDRSLNSPDPRETLFGFEKLTTPEVGPRVRRCKPGLEASGSVTGLSSFTSLLLLEADDAGQPEPDPNIPGVTLVKEKRRRRKAPQIAPVELEALAAEMNAVFEEAEEFELVVE
ncbi:sororin [Hippoglossus hippoglossus]|uniref:sororin n=1 Tax=Hippoglossus hippoglossus TaxID=8267 RepID=UPI00148BF01B|nr:sororin [Hippoglossus hippoglossus]